MSTATTTPPPRVAIDSYKGNSLTIMLRDIDPALDPVVFLGGVEAKKNAASVRRNPDRTMSFDVEIPASIKPGKVALEVRVGEEILKPEPAIDLPDPLVAAGKQPEIITIRPAGGMERATITITGKNFGENIEKVWVILGDRNYAIGPIAMTRPNEMNQQELTFAIPTVNGSGNKGPIGILGQHSLYHRANVTVNVNGRGANWGYLNVIHPYGLWKVAGLSLLLILTLLAPFLALAHWQSTALVVTLLGVVLAYSLLIDYLWIAPAVLLGVALAWVLWAQTHQQTLYPVVKTLFIDKGTNTYSLSKFQAFLWSVVLLGSYLYFALGRGILIKTDEIPDFNTSLLGLMSISYGGLLAARGISRKISKNDLTPDPPRLRELITEGGGISITRLQLMGFTIVIIAVYLYYVSSADLFLTGLPDIPPTLNGLMAISQGGYLGGKVLGDVAVNYILPRRARAGETLKIFGVGFVDKTKVLIQGVPEPQEARYLSPTSVEVTLPPQMGEPGIKQLVFAPPTGSSFVIEGILELIAPRVVSKQPLGASQLLIMLTGVELGDGELRATIDTQAARVEQKAPHEFLLTAASALTPESTIQLTTADGIALASTTVGAG